MLCDNSLQNLMVWNNNNYLLFPMVSMDQEFGSNWAAVCDKWDKLEACDLWGEDTKDISAFIVVSWITLSGGNL